MPNDTSQRRALLWRFWECASGFWKRKHARVSWPLTIGLVAIALAQIAVQYRLNYWNRDFFNALERRDAVRLWEEAWLFAPLAGLSILLSVAAVWGRMLSANGANGSRGICWRCGSRMTAIAASNL